MNQNWDFVDQNIEPPKPRQEDVACARLYPQGCGGRLRIAGETNGKDVRCVYLYI